MLCVCNSAFQPWFDDPPRILCVLIHTFDVPWLRKNWGRCDGDSGFWAGAADAAAVTPRVVEWAVRELPCTAARNLLSGQQGELLADAGAAWWIP